MAWIRAHARNLAALALVVGVVAIVGFALLGSDEGARDEPDRRVARSDAASSPVNTLDTPRVAAAFTAVRIPAVRAGLAQGRAPWPAGREVWTSTRYLGERVTAEQVIALVIEAMADRDAIAFGEPFAQGASIVVAIDGDDAIVGPYEGSITIGPADRFGASLAAELRMTFEERSVATR